MGLFSSRSRSTVTTTIPDPTPEEISLVNQQLDVAANQQQNLAGLTNFTAEVFQQFLPTLVNEVNKFLPQENQITAQMLGFGSEVAGEQSGLLQRELAAIDRGVALTPDQERLISESANAAIQTGLSDIGQFRDESLRTLAQETAIGRGLRPEDTPILDVGGRIINESTRQASQLVNTIRGQEAEQRLRYPIEAGRFIQERTNAQQAFGANNAAFMAQLRQQAFNNRLNLVSTTGNIGTNAAGIGPSPATLNALTAARLAQTTTKTKGKASPGIIPSIASLAGGLGGLGSGYADFRNVGSSSGGVTY